MFNLPPSVRLFIAAQLVDGRKGPDSLMTLVRDVLGQDIFDGHLFVFFTRRRDRVRIPAPGESRLAANSFEQSNVGQILRSTGSALVCDQVFERNDRHGQVADVDRHCAPERSLRVDPIGPLQNVDAYGWHPPDKPLLSAACFEPPPPHGWARRTRSMPLQLATGYRPPQRRAGPDPSSLGVWRECQRHSRRAMRT